MEIITYSAMSEEERKEQLEAFIKRYNRFFQKTLLAMLSGLVPRRNIPDLVLNTGKECFTDHSKIVLGMDQEDAQTEQELYAFVYYVLGHEVQHILSTTQKPWAFGIMTGVKHVIAYFQKLYGYPQIPIVGEANMRNAISRMQKDGHLVPEFDQMADFCHYICNAVEDGRIERHRTGIYPGYGRYVRLYRGKMWKRMVVEAPQNPQNANDLLQLYCNEVLSLATCHVYGQGFWKNYAGSAEAETVDKIRRHVTKAVYSRKCKQCMSECIDIIDIITPVFAQAYITNPSSAFMQALKQLIESILNHHGEEGFSERKESGEQAADGNGKNPFGSSILGSPEIDESGNITGEIKDEGDGQEGDAAVSAQTGKDGKGNPSEAQGERKREDNVGSNHAGEAGVGQFSESALDKEMQEAAAQISSDFSASNGNIRGSGPSARADVSDMSSEAPRIAKTRDINFVEKQRAYKVEIPLPFIIEEQARTLKEQVHRIFKPKKTGAYKKKTKGKVSPERIFTLAINEGDCFEIRKKPDKFSGCCYILQDNSGSMGCGRNSKRMFACEASARIEYAFKDYMPLKIVAFDEAGGKVIHEVVKNWNDNFQHSCSYNFFHKGRDGSCNADYHDITIATDELLARPEKEKILIVISDGLPCRTAGCEGSPEASVKATVEYARSRGIKVVGIYIDDVVNDADRATYESMYGSSCVFTDTDHISEELTRVMTSWAHR